MLNLKVRFSKHNLTFVMRFVGALLIPVLAYMGIKFEDINSWNAMGKVLIEFLSNPYLVLLTFVNAINLLPDPTTPGIKDGEIGMKYKKPGEM